MKNTDFNLVDIKPKPSLSQRFDELAVALPEHIEQPTLKLLASKLQSQLFLQIRAEALIKQQKNTTEGVESSLLNINNQGDGDIAKANMILQYLTHTENAQASVLVAITNEPHPRILLTRRAGHLNAHAGEVSFAGGKHEQSDGNNVVTALREACEETALPPKKVQIIGQLPIQTSKSGMSVRPIVALIEPNIAYVPELGEIARIFWGDLESLITQPTSEYRFNYQASKINSKENGKENGKNNANNTVSKKLEVNNHEIVTPCWIIDGETVWGLTARIIASLLEIGFERKVEWYYRPVVSSNINSDISNI